MKKAIKWLFKTIFIIFLIFVGIFYLINSTIVVCEVNGSSMAPTLSQGDKGIAFRNNINGIDRFDIVIIEKDANYILIKRVIGLPNETIEYKDNKLYVNGVYIAEDFLLDDVVTHDFKVELNDDEYFCLGDNRGVSGDSRIYGAFISKQIIGKDFRIIENKE